MSNYLTENDAYKEILQLLTTVNGATGYCPITDPTEHGGVEQFKRNYNRALSRIMNKGLVEFIEIDGCYRVTDKGMSVYLVLQDIQKMRITK
jgi:hypothetical protein